VLRVHGAESKQQAMNNGSKSDTSGGGVDPKPPLVLRTVVLSGVLALLLVGFAVWLYLRRSSRIAEIKIAHAGGALAGSSVSPRRHGAMAPPAAGAIAPGKVIVKGGWGSAPGQFGRRADPESAQEGPMSLALGKSGELYVLDQINGRVARFRRDGSPAGEIKIGSDTVQDIAIDKRGDVLALDRLADKDLTIYGSDGQPKTRIGVVGGPITEGGGVTGLYADDDGIWLGREHAEIVRGADPDGKTDPNRPTEPGPPTRDGRYFLWARLADAGNGAALLRAYDHDGQVVWARTLAFGRPILHIILVDSDARERVYA